MKKAKKTAIVLCSGGLDSVTTAHYVKKKLSKKYSDIITLFFDYKQRSLDNEKICASLCAEEIDAKFIEIPLHHLTRKSRPLTDKSAKAKEVSLADLKNTKKESEKWYLPHRNEFFIKHAFVISDYLHEKKGRKSDIFLGFKSEGKESYPDTTPEFVEKMNYLAKTTKSKPKVIAPLIKKDKEDIISLARELGINFNKTFSCYAPKEKLHCGYCLSCRLRQEGFYWANIIDPTLYYKKMQDFRSA